MRLLKNQEWTEITKRNINAFPPKRDRSALYQFALLIITI